MVNNPSVPLQTHASGTVALAITRFLSISPVIGTILVLMSGLLKFKLLVWLTIASFVFVMFIGSSTWIILTIY